MIGTGTKLQPFADAPIKANDACGGQQNGDMGVTVPTQVFTPGQEIAVQWTMTISHPATSWTRVFGLQSITLRAIASSRTSSPAASRATTAGGLHHALRGPAGVDPADRAERRDHHAHGHPAEQGVRLLHAAVGVGGEQDGGSYIGCADIAIKANGQLPNYAALPSQQGNKLPNVPAQPGEIIAAGPPPPPLSPGEVSPSLGDGGAAALPAAAAPARSAARASPSSSRRSRCRRRRSVGPSSPRRCASSASHVTPSGRRSSIRRRSPRPSSTCACRRTRSRWRSPPASPVPSSSTSSPTASSSAASARPSASRPSSSTWASRRRASSATSCRSSGARAPLFRAAAPPRRRLSASLPAPSAHAARRAPVRRLALLALLVLQLVLCPSHPSSGASLGFYFLALGPLLIAALPSRRKLRTAVEEDAQKALLRAVAYPHLIALPLLLGIAGAQQWGLHSACGSSGLQVELEFLLYIMSGDEGRGPIGTAEAEASRAHDLRARAFMLIVILVPTLIAGALALTWFCKSRKGGGGGLPSLRKGGGGKGARRRTGSRRGGSR